ncbi:MAG: hypothetical protein LBJ65_25575 [Burkholderia sp.]|jgi:hypothetical protein|uniref:hypothetical protein n=1 Tax=Burkholderia sp. TaxID=36773 RepID=UPI002826698C|nr:hypothetical protein [Burkholderia sp.]MDR0244981.1 hypothetical protein [Burkholderia sp.]
MIFAIDSVKTAKRAIAAAGGCTRMRTGCAWRREGNTNRINALRRVPNHRAKRVERMAVRERDALRAARDIDMRKTSLDRPEPDGYMPSLFSTD